VRRWLREPLLLFVAGGIALFAGYSALQPAADPDDASTRIELTEDDLRQLVLAWMAQWKRPPTTQELRGLIDERVREEILYREALAMGLDDGDTIVKRRLAQKMAFLAEDMAALREPSNDELKTWFAANATRFELPERISFHHLYFSVDKRGAGAETAAMAALDQLAGSQDGPGAAAGLGDPFMFRDFYGDRSPRQVAAVFGAEFSRALAEFKPKAWQGPIKSGLGWHLVWIDSISPSRVPALEEVEAIVRADWLYEQRTMAKEAAFEAMRMRYKVMLPDILTLDTVGALAPQNSGPQ
jgi:hypothetical protein